jgi:hypothetical protein
MVKWLIWTLEIDPTRFDGIKGEPTSFTFKVELDKSNPQTILT